MVLVPLVCRMHRHAACVLVDSSLVGPFHSPWLRVRLPRVLCKHFVSATHSTYVGTVLDYHPERIWRIGLFSCHDFPQSRYGRNMRMGRYNIQVGVKTQKEKRPNQSVQRNAGICHAACDRMSDRMPTMKSKFEGRTRRASSRRG
jgi:hypothetical protein